MLGFFGFDGLLNSSVHDGLNLHSVGWVSNEEWQFLLHLDLIHVEDTVEVGPELELVSLSSEIRKSNLVHADSCHDLIGGEIALITLKIWSVSSLGHDVVRDRNAISNRDELLGSSSIVRGDSSALNS